MRHVRLGRDAEFVETPSGERICVMLGRHERHGAARHHTVAAVELAAGAASDPHFHAEREESYVILAGIGAAVIGAKRVEVIAGDLLFAEPGERHQFFAGADAILRYLVITAPCWTPTDSHSAETAKS